jgi:hypothetical protein
MRRRRDPEPDGATDGDGGALLRPPEFDRFRTSGYW